MEYIRIRGARTHNLKNVSLDLPRNKMIVITGLSGSGKSSLAFDTLYAEGQRRYVESLSAYARQFLARMDKPDVDFIEDDAFMEVPEDLKMTSTVLGKVIQSFKEQGAALGKELPFSKPYRFNECGWVANRWCELLQLSPGQKQFFLEQESPRLRLDLIHELLEEMGVYKAVK